MGDNKNDFSRGSIASHIARLAIPMTIAQLINVLYNIIDRVFIGHIPEDSANALTGLGVAFPLCTVTIAFANLVGSGGAPLLSMERGKGDKKAAEEIIGCSFLLLIIFGVGLSALMAAFKLPLLYLLGASKATIGYAADYITIYLWGTVFVMISLGLNFFINAQGFAKIGMATVSIGAVINLVLDPVFIFVFDMGVKGAALATVISQCAASLWTLGFLTGEKAEERLRLKYLRLKAKWVKKILSLGLSGFVMQISNSAVQIVCNKTLAVYGGDLYIGVMTVLNSVREVANLGVSGIGSGSQPIIGFNYGAAKPQRVKKTIRLMAAALLAYTAGAWLIIMLFSSEFIRCFNKDPQLLTIGVRALHIYFFGYFMMAFQFSGQTVFQSLGMSRFAIFFSLLRKAVIVIPLTCLLPVIDGIGVWGVFLAEPVSNFLGGSACFITMYFRIYRRLQ